MNWHDYFTYSNGALIWRTRPLSHFSCERIMKKCNTQYSGKIAGCKDLESGYILLNINKRRFLAHRIIWEMHNGAILEGYEIDHINHIRDDNRIKNLRLVRKKDNQKNLSKNKRNRTGLTGVTITKDGSYYAQIGVLGKTFCIGYFKTIFDAACARRSKENELKYHCNHGR